VGIKGLTSSTPFMVLMVICSKNFLKSVSGTYKLKKHIEPNEHEASQRAW